MTLNLFFEPKSVAIIGASHTAGKVGNVIAENFNSGFSGKVFFVNPNTEPIFGKEVFSSVKKIQEKIDLAVIAVKSTLVPQVLEECASKKIPAAIIISSGFSEIGREGAILEERLKKIISKKKIRIIGPNVVGVYDSSTKIDTIFLPKKRLSRPPQGGIAFVTQSGAVGSTIMDWIADEGIGVSKFVSYGNAVDINETDLINFFGDDEKTKVVVCYMEGLKSDGRKFVDVAKKVVSKKPVVILKAGKTEKGSKAVASHTGSIAGSAKIYSAVFKQFGITEANDWEELFDFAKGFAMQPLPKGNKLLIVTNGGGFGVLAVDEAEKQNLEIKEVPEHARKVLHEKLVSYASIHNPMDLTAEANASAYETVFGETMKDFDGVIAIALFQVPALEENIVDVLISMQKLGKPILCCAAGGNFTRLMSERLESHGVPVYPTPGRAVKTFATMLSYSKFLQKK
jgi:acetyl coenzyme A synthetase (ADP forming)-like protein